MSRHITFYDIASGPPIRPFAPNPWKTRYALNFKHLPYKTCWVELTEVAEVRKSLGAAPVRKHDIDGSDFYTLPVIVDHATGQTVGDSFDIALYLDRQYPSKGDEPSLFPPLTVPLHRVFNSHVDKVFTNFVALVNLPFNPETAAQSQAEFCRRMGRESSCWDDLALRGEDRAVMLRNFESALGELAGLYIKKDQGPFLEGGTPMYADLIVGGWLCMFKEALPEWEMVQQWQDGLWGRLCEALQEYAQTH